MKCTSKIEYDCFFLYKNNIEEFIEWINNKFTKVYNYIIYDDFLIMSFEDPNYDEEIFDEELNNLKCYYNRWYVIKHGDLFDYDAKYFIKQYNLSTE